MNQESTIHKIYTWTWSEKTMDIKIYDQNKMIGFIYSFWENKVAHIGGEKFFIDQPKKMYRTFITNPNDNKAYCEIEYLRFPKFKMNSPNFEYTCDRKGFWPFKRSVSLERNKQKTSELIIPRAIFPMSGIINVMNEENWEMEIYALFYFNSCEDPNVS